MNLLRCAFCFLILFLFFFFFKQKTAYEMRISDWSSDVCSSDLLARVADEPALTVTEINPEFVVESAASPYDKAFVDAATRAVRAAFGDVPVIASQASGASDSMWYRALGVPSYGASGTFTKDSDDYSHGLNERVPIGNVDRSIAYYHALLKERS